MSIEYYIIKLHFKHELSIKEIAAIINKTELYVAKIIAVEKQTITDLRRKETWLILNEEQKNQ